MLQLGTNEDREACWSLAQSGLAPLDVDVLLTHGNCPDGSFAAFEFRHFYHSITIKALDHPFKVTEELIELVSKRNVLMVDIAPANSEDYDALEKASKRFAVLDHHKSAEIHDGRPLFVRVGSLSGASMMYYYIAKYKVSKYFESTLGCVHARDLFVFLPSIEKFQKDFSLVFATELRTNRTLEEGLDYIAKVCQGGEAYYDIVNDKKGIVKAMKENVDFLVGISYDGHMVDHDDYEARSIDLCVRVVDTRGHESKLGAMNDTGDFLSKTYNRPVAFIKAKNDRLEVSLRGEGSLDIAKRFGGGGHPKAAAFSTDKELSDFIHVPEHPFPRDLEKRLYPWQQQIWDSAEEFDTRIINCVVDPSGNHGKSTIASLMELHGRGVDLPPINDAEKLIQSTCNILYARKCRNPKTLFIDMPRAMCKSKLSEFYTAIETIKKGKLYDTRYSYKSWWIDSPQIWVFTNTAPDLSLLTTDRWKIWKIVNNTLTQ